MPGLSDTSSGLTRQCSHSNDSAVSPSSAPSTHKAFSFIRTSSFSFTAKSRSFTEPPPIPESDKEPIFDEIRDCDEAPYPLPPQTRKMSAPGPIDVKKPRAEYKSLNGDGHTRATSAIITASVPIEIPSTPSAVPMPVPPHKHKWLNKLDPRFNAKLMEEKQKTIERQERERKKKKEDEEMIGELLRGWGK